MFSLCITHTDKKYIELQFVYIKIILKKRKKRKKEQSRTKTIRKKEKNGE